MTGGHLTDFELLEKLYGVGLPGDHLERCPECRERYERLDLRRKQLLTLEPEVEWQRLVHQRESILQAAIKQKRALWAQLAPILAVAALLVVAVGLSTVTPHSPNFSNSNASASYEEPVSEWELWEEVYAVLRNPQPAALEPVRELFEAEP